MSACLYNNTIKLTLRDRTTIIERQNYNYNDTKSGQAGFKNIRSKSSFICINIV